MRPVNMLLLRRRNERFERFPRELGMEPVKLLWYKSRLTRAYMGEMHKRRIILSCISHDIKTIMQCTLFLQQEYLNDKGGAENHRTSQKDYLIPH
jgi:hypothetical protein